ncbi:MAG: ribonuclease HII [Candidatus Pacebacteria bacterium]|nr:ribonuclease HII [Candidatus Paceibacterota bacterium]
MSSKKYIIGIDEVGRGPLAGPVAVCALALPEGLKIKKTGLKDSKKLSAKQREEWLEYIKKCPQIFYAVSRVYPNIIDKINISQAANLAANRSLEKLFGTYKLNYKKCRVLLDGGLFVSEKYKARTIIKGDEKITAIKLASIAAKVDRDGLLEKYAEKFKKYGFDMHKGYGTKHHIKIIKKHGPLKIHRLTFLKNL